ncbi:uncharacterized protein LOC125188417 isoform X1 [Salvia hispanica]|uniref:uncharacterized protein LOC125188417 isoform X1 n=1 Tax=Salvia hispanica TaxID=49212 RepID=UPI0020093490|nr:uncharacterized protein LOC125188417 isoform X1 [Salvia hispanica]XP_047941201.1 uncharacterized protein LOC125188417 isoform X1 [Salvia hispanica]
MDMLSTEICCDEKANIGKKKTQKSKKTIVKDGVRSLDQNNMYTQLVNESTDGNVFVDKLIKDEVQNAGRSKMGTRSMAKLAGGNETIEKPIDKDKHQFSCQSEVDRGSSQHLTGVSVAIENSELLDEYPSNIDTGSTKVIAQGTVPGKRTKKRKRTAKAETEAEAQRELNARILAEENLTTKESKMKDEIQKNGLTKAVIGNQKIQDETQSMCCSNLNNGQVQIAITKRKIKKANLTNEKPKVKDELQTLDHNQMKKMSPENLADGKVITENSKTLDEAQSMDQNSMDKWQPEGNLAQGDVAGKRIKKGKKKKKAKVNDEFQSEVNARPVNLAEGVATLSNQEIKDAAQSLAQTEMDTGSTDSVSERNVTIDNPEVQDEIQSIDLAKKDTRPTQNLAEGIVIVKRKKKHRKTKKEKVEDEFLGRMDARPTEKLDKANVNIKVPGNGDEVPNVVLAEMDIGSTDNVNVSIKLPKDEDEFQIREKVDIRPTQHSAEGNATVKREKRRQKKDKKAKVEDEFSGRRDAGPTEKLAEVNVNAKILETRDEVPNVGMTPMDTGSTAIVAERNVIIEKPKVQDEFQIIDQAKVDTGPTQRLEGNATVKRKKRRGKAKKEKVKDEFSSRMDEGSTENLERGNGHAEGRSAVPTCNACTAKDAEILWLKTTPIVSVRKKLIVLDINGLLADVVFPAPKHYKADIKILGRAVFKRPFCDDFLKFCFQNFYVGIWSSRAKKILDAVVSYLLGDQKDKLLFCWDMRYCTQTGFKTLENRHKPLVCKELRNIWEKDNPSIPWKKGDFDETNTVLLDDSPYKSLLNPLHSAISPNPYQYSDTNDNSLGPGGDLRVYLDGLAASENVQNYVEQHPFGQRPIGEQDLSWEFYCRVLKQMSNDEISQSQVEA